MPHPYRGRLCELCSYRSPAGPRTPFWCGPCGNNYLTRLAESLERALNEKEHEHELA